MNDLDDVRARVQELGLTRIRVEIPDTDGNLRGKYAAVDKLLAGKGASVSDVYFALSVADDVFDAQFMSPDTGYPDIVAWPDWSTLRPVAWERGLGAVICDFRTKRGEPLAIDSRLALRGACERCTAAGFEAWFGTEYEIYLFYLDEAAEQAIRERRPRDLVPVSREWQAYSLSRWPEKAEFVADLTDDMAAYGVPIEAVSTELGYGMIEVALAPAPPLEAADRAARFKLGCKEIAKRHGLLASFIAKWDTSQSGSSGHLHQSLLQDGRNTFWAGEQDAISTMGRNYLAGLIATATELSAFMSPFPNSYRRYVPDTWAPTNVTWGFDNRNACFRVITTNEASARIEHRRPGADLQPYLSIAASLDGGLLGVLEEMQVPPAAPGRAYASAHAEAFPTDLRGAAQRLRESELATRLYGRPLIEHYATSREAEATYWEQLRDAQVPDWEVSRYLEVV